MVENDLGSVLAHVTERKRRNFNYIYGHYTLLNLSDLLVGTNFDNGTQEMNARDETTVDERRQIEGRWRDIDPKN